MSGNLSICHVITTTRRGGAEIQLLRLIRSTAPQGVEHLVVGLEPTGDLVPDLEGAGAQVISLNLERGLAALFRGVRALTHILREKQPLLVQTWMYHADLLGLLAARRAGGLPVVWGLRCSDLTVSLPTRLVVQLCALMSRRPAAVIANSRAGLDFHRRRGYRCRRMQVIVNGFDLDEISPDQQIRAQVRQELNLGKSALLVGQVANFKPVKDILGFLAAAVRVAQENPAVHIVLIGQGMTPDNQAFAPYRKELPDGRLHLLGLRQDVPRLLTAMDIFVLSSLSEGFPNVVGEAMAAGLPVVTTDVGDARELVGPTGAITQPGDPQALAQAIDKLLKMEPSARSALGAKARQRIAERYSAPVMAAAYLDLYGEILAEGG